MGWIILTCGVNKIKKKSKKSWVDFRFDFEFCVNFAKNLFFSWEICCNFLFVVNRYVIDHELVAYWKLLPILNPARWLCLFCRCEFLVFRIALSNNFYKPLFLYCLLVVFCAIHKTKPFKKYIYILSIKNKNKNKIMNIYFPFDLTIFTLIFCLPKLSKIMLKITILFILYLYILNNNSDYIFLFKFYLINKMYLFYLSHKNYHHTTIIV